MLEYCLWNMHFGMLIIFLFVSNCKKNYLSFLKAIVFNYWNFAQNKLVFKCVFYLC
jgi:hypothetical protein